MLAGNLTSATRQGTSVTVRNEDGRNILNSTTEYETTKTKQRDSWWQTEITPPLPIAGKNSPRYLEIFAIFRDCSLFIPRFLAEPLTTFCETLVGKHRNKPKNIILGSGSSDRATFKTHALANSFYKFIRTYFILIFNIKFKSGREKDYNPPEKGKIHNVHIILPTTRTAAAADAN